MPDAVEVKVLCVAETKPPLLAVGAPLHREAPPAAGADEVATARERAAQAVEFLRRGGRTAEPIVASGHAGERIVEAAREWPADFLLLGAHAKQGWLPDLLGNTARDVVHRANCSVWVTRTQSAGV